MRLSELKQNEFNHFYATYLNMVGEEELIETLESSRDWFVAYTSGLTKERLNFSYGPNKWTVAEVLVHITDTERIFQYRAFRFSKNDKTALPGFDHEDYVGESESEKRTIGEIVAEFLAVREATLTMFKGMSNEKLRRIGTASDMPWSVAALGFVISGHLKHHAKILEERYS
ncbi:DinB family protein [Maribacter chungangensis]|uniref:DinB family protein n=1 Tax=Maribacter chungangensis TaxID=1069117 RepID=A0ABW3B5F9_9FLAO